MLDKSTIYVVRWNAFDDRRNNYGEGRFRDYDRALEIAERMRGLNYRVTITWETH